MTRGRFRRRAGAVAGLALMWAVVLLIAQEDRIDLPDVVVVAVLAATVTLAALGGAAYVGIRDTLTGSVKGMFDAACEEATDCRKILETIAGAVEVTDPAPPGRAGLAAVRQFGRRPPQEDRSA